MPDPKVTEESAPLFGGPAFGMAKAVHARSPGANVFSERMFCEEGHERVEWSRAYPAWENCWYCGEEGLNAYISMDGGEYLHYVV